MHISFQVNAFLFFIVYPRVKLMDHMVIMYLVFWGISILFHIVVAPVYITTNRVQVSPFLHAHKHQGQVFDASHSGSDITGNHWFPFLWLMMLSIFSLMPAGHQYIIFGKTPVQVSCPFNWFFFVMLNCMIFFYVFDIELFIGYYHCQIFPICIVFLFCNGFLWETSCLNVVLVCIAICSECWTYQIQRSLLVDGCYLNYLCEPGQEISVGDNLISKLLVYFCYLWCLPQKLGSSHSIFLYLKLSNDIFHWTMVDVQCYLSTCTI